MDTRAQLSITNTIYAVESYCNALGRIVYIELGGRVMRRRDSEAGFGVGSRRHARVGSDYVVRFGQ